MFFVFVSFTLCITNPFITDFNQNGDILQVKINLMYNQELGLQFLELNTTKKSYVKLYQNFEKFLNECNEIFFTNFIYLIEGKIKNKEKILDELYRAINKRNKYVEILKKSELELWGEMLEEIVKSELHKKKTEIIIQIIENNYANLKKIDDNFI